MTHRHVSVLFRIIIITLISVALPLSYRKYYVLCDGVRGEDDVLPCGASYYVFDRSVM